MSHSIQLSYIKPAVLVQKYLLRYQILPQHTKHTLLNTNYTYYY